MMTSSFRIARNHPRAVAIVRYLPRWQPFRGRVYRALAPSHAMFHLPDAEFDRAYRAHLATLDPREVYDELGPNAVLLCFEAPGLQCHRRICAEWFETALGIEVPELGVPRDQTPTYLESAIAPSASKRRPKNQLSFLKSLLRGMHVL